VTGSVHLRGVMRRADAGLADVLLACQAGASIAACDWLCRNEAPLVLPRSLAVCQHCPVRRRTNGYGLDVQGGIEMSKDKRSSRREFLKQATVVGTTVAAAGVLGHYAAPGADAQDVPAPALPVVAPETAAPAPSKPAAVKWDADVIVVGTGGSGLIAAINAVNHGAKVLQLDKVETMGGCWMISGGSSSAAMTRMQLQAGILDDSVDLFYKDCMRMGRFLADPEILRFHVANATAAVDWMDSIGGYKNRTPQPDIYDPPFSVKRNYQTESGKDFFKAVQAEHQKRVDRGDIKVMMKTRVTDLVVEEGRVAGVKVKAADGSEKEFRAGAVILCTGGYTNNVELVKKYNYPEAVSTALPHCTGDGIVMIEKLNGAFVDMDYLPPYVGGMVDPKAPGVPLANTNMNKYPGAIWVNYNGKRVVNEDVGGLTDKAKYALAEAPKATLFVILDKKIMAENKPIVDKWDWNEFEKRAQEGIAVKKANTIEELAKAWGIDSAALKKTVDTYNGYVAAGQDPDFGRKELKYKIENGPFYAIKTVPSLLLSKGGPKINDKMQVIDKNNKIIPGLYVAGELAGGSKVSGHGNVTGVANTINMVFGRRAGEMAAQEALNRRLVLSV
jgi:fumarate reductase flavoprotein subunit